MKNLGPFTTEVDWRFIDSTHFTIKDAFWHQYLPSMKSQWSNFCLLNESWRGRSRVRPRWLPVNKAKTGSASYQAKPYLSHIILKLGRSELHQVQRNMFKKAYCPESKSGVFFTSERKGLACITSSRLQSPRWTKEVLEVDPLAQNNRAPHHFISGFPKSDHCYVNSTGDKSSLEYQALVWQRDCLTAIPGLEGFLTVSSCLSATQAFEDRSSSVL